MSAHRGCLVSLYQLVCPTLPHPAPAPSASKTRYLPRTRGREQEECCGSRWVCGGGGAACGRSNQASAQSKWACERSKQASAQSKWACSRSAQSTEQSKWACGRSNQVTENSFWACGRSNQSTENSLWACGRSNRKPRRSVTIPFRPVVRAGQGWRAQIIRRCAGCHTVPVCFSCVSGGGPDGIGGRALRASGAFFSWFASGTPCLRPGLVQVCLVRAAPPRTTAASRTTVKSLGFRFQRAMRARGCGAIRHDRRPRRTPTGVLGHLAHDVDAGAHGTGLGGLA
jgi:hypothetical protein